MMPRVSTIICRALLGATSFSAGLTLFDMGRRSPGPVAQGRTGEPSQWDRAGPPLSGPREGRRP